MRKLDKLKKDIAEMKPQKSEYTEKMGIPQE